jgi:hypothetical protein
MADRNGYIGRAPSDSAVTVARQTFTPTGITTDFTFTSGYVPGYFDIYINGVKMIEGSDYTSSDGSTFAVLGGGATNGDVIEAVAYKAFNAASVNNAPGNFSVAGELSFGSVAAGSSVSFATTAFNLDGTPDITVRNFTGVAGTFSGFVAFSTSISVGGTITYEDVENIDSVGLITARNGIDVTGGNVTIGTGSTVGFGSTAFFPDGAKAVFGDSEDFAIYHDGTNSYIVEGGTGGLRVGSSRFEVRNPGDTKTSISAFPAGEVELYYNNSKKLETTGAGVTITGVCTATSFEGSGANLTNLPASGDSNDITACLFI